MSWIKWFITSAERELKDWRGTGMFQSCIGMSRSCFGISSRYLRVLWFILILIILARNIDCKSILQKTLKQFGLVASKYERKLRYKSNFQCVSLRRRVCLICRAMFLQSAFQFGFYRRNLVFLPWNLAWNSFYTVENLNLLVCRLNSPPIDQNFSSVLRRSIIIIFERTVPPCFWFYFSKSSGRNNAKYAFQYTFKNNTTRYAKNKKEKKERTK